MIHEHLWCPKRFRSCHRQQWCAFHVDHKAVTVLGHISTGCPDECLVSAVNTQALPGLSDSFTQQHSANSAKQWYTCLRQEIQNIIVSCGQEIQNVKFHFLLIHTLKRNLNTKDCVSQTPGVPSPPCWFFPHSIMLVFPPFMMQQEQTGKCNLYSRDCVSKMFINSIFFI